MTSIALRHLTMVFAAIVIAGCANNGLSAAMAKADAVFVLVRHAEKGTDDPKDPSLTDAGHARAARLAALLGRVDAVYATRYRRTHLTAAPTAAASHLTITTYDASMLAEAFVQQLRTAHPSDIVLVVGHSNTVAPIAESLCACRVEPLRDDEYDRMITIRIDHAGKASIEQTRY
jgi:broad specificity phosphatase PhoE